jgi:hypothetical protein
MDVTRWAASWSEGLHFDVEVRLREPMNGSKAVTFGAVGAGLADDPARRGGLHYSRQRQLTGSVLVSSEELQALVTLLSGGQGRDRDLGRQPCR